MKFTINKLVFLLFLILTFSITYSTTPSWITNTSVCNSYRYYTNTGFSGINMYASNGSVYSGMPSHCTYGAGYNFCDAFEITNAGEIDTRGYGASWANGITLPLPCPSTVCTYLVEITNQYGGSLFNTSMTFHLYSGCNIPTLNIVNSYPSTVMSDRYRLNFTIDNAIGWSGIICSLSLNGSNSYSISFATNGSLDILYSDYPKEMTIAHTVCTYWNQNNNTVIFYDHSWLLDSMIPYVISDLSGSVGHVSTTPEILNPFNTLTYIGFKVVSAYDKTDYGKPIIAVISTTADLSSIGCTGNINFTGELQSPNYMVPESIYCTNNSIIPIIVTAKSAADLTTISQITINVSWVQGTMLIDNVNLITSLDDGHLELWADVSSRYEKQPIPVAASLACVYSITSLNDSAVFPTANMTNVYIYATPQGGDLTHSQVKDDNIINSGPYYNGNSFLININCSAGGFANYTMSGSRYIGYFRLREFNCYLATQLPYYKYPSNSLHYAQPYDTHNASVVCNIETDIASQPGAHSDAYYGNLTLALSLLVGTNSSSTLNGYGVELFSNIDATYTSNCPDLIPINIYPPWVVDDFGYYSTEIDFIQSFHKNDANCVKQQLQQESATNAVVFGLSYNGSARYTPIGMTFSYIPYNLLFAQDYSQTVNILRIANNKTVMQGTVQQGDMLICQTVYYDPNLFVEGVTHEYVDDNGINICPYSSVAAEQPIGVGNNTYEWDSYVIIDNTTCPSFAALNTSGTVKCIATLTVFSEGNHLYYSNSLPYAGPVPPGPSAPELYWGGFWGWLINSPLSPLSQYVALAQNNTIMFVLITLMLPVILVIVLWLAYFVFELVWRVW